MKFFQGCRKNNQGKKVTKSNKLLNISKDIKKQGHFLRKTIFTDFQTFLTPILVLMEN